MDLFPTIAGQCGLEPPKPTDGVDIWPLLTGQSSTVKRDAVCYFSDWYLQCIRRDDWKLHMARYNGWIYTPGLFPRMKNLPLPAPELYNLALDPDESYDLADRHPDIVRDLLARAEALIPTFPEQVRTAWANTKALKVRPTAAGAYPVEAAN